VQPESKLVTGLRQLQMGLKLTLPHSRPMPAIGGRCHELRINEENKTWRIIYRIDPDAIVILEVFEKKSKKTPSEVLENCNRRIRLYESECWRKYMKTAKRKRLEAKGWKFGNSTEFLGLSTEESAYVELKLALSKNLQTTRKEKNLTQEELARLLKSSQSRIAKMEAGDPSVSLDLLVRSLLVLGTSRKTLSRILA
jgi:phage-related protein/DNA-binding XRE family transcriptional regulator